MEAQGGNADVKNSIPKTGSPGPEINSNPSVKAPLFTDPTMVGILVAVLVIIFTIMYFYIKTKKKGRSVLIVGPSESGKSTVFVKLAFKKNVDTVTSTTPNIIDYEVPDRAPLILKDLPGHERVRTKFWEAHRVGVRGILCVIDGAGGNKAVREAAEVLYTVLSDGIVNSVQPQILVFCNKQDLPTAKGPSVLQHQLEREITTLRLTKSASLQTTGGSSGSATTKALGKLDRDFEFEHVTPIKVTFAEGSATGDGDNESNSLKSIASWLKDIA